MNTDFERVRRIFLAIVEQPSAQWEALLEVRLMPEVQYPGQCALARLRPGVRRG